jgi:hypothetical protein
MTLRRSVSDDGRVLSVKEKGSPVFACATAQTCAADVVLRGSGAAAAKSAELLLVSAQPLPFLTTALVTLGAGARAVSKQLAEEP